MENSKRLSLVAIGDEVLCGHTVNTNAATIALACTKIGRTPLSHTVVGDDAGEMEKALRRELALGGDIIAFGGLGPTLDDHTREVIAKIFETRLVVRSEYLHELEERYGKEYPTIRNQAAQPEKALLFTNTVGTAPGILLEDEKLFPGSRLFALPGPPHELKDVFERGILARIEKGKRAFSVWLTFIGAAEYDVDCSLQRLQTRWPAITCGIYPSYEAVSIHLVHEDEALLEQAREVLLNEFQHMALPEDMPSIEAYCVELLKERGWTIAAAESCTGGAFAAKISSVSGASSVFLGSVVAYQDGVKERVLAVPEKVIEQHGVVSEEVTQHMAEGVRALMGSDVSIAVSGYFGPTGGTFKTPLGTVCATIIFPTKNISQTFVFKGTRASICARTVGALLTFLSRVLRER